MQYTEQPGGISLRAVCHRTDLISILVVFVYGVAQHVDECAAAVVSPVCPGSWQRRGQAKTVCG